MRKTAKQYIGELEEKLQEYGHKAKDKAGNLILDTSDNVFTQKELKKIRRLEAWAVVGPIVGFVIAYLIF